MTKERYGIEVCPLCHQPVENRFYKENGHKGGLIGGMVTFLKYGREHMKKIGGTGGRGNTREKRLRRLQNENSR